MRRLFTIGVRQEYPAYLNQKIKASNQVAAFLVVLALLFVIQFNVLEWNDLIFVPVTALITFLSIFLFNRIGASDIARFITAVGPMALININHAYTIEGGTPLIPQVLAMALSTFVLPFILFDYRELPKLIAAVALLVLQIIFLPKLVALLEVEKEGDYLYDTFTLSTFLQYTCVAMTILVGVLFMISRNGYRFEKNVEKANQERDEQYREMEHSQQQLQDTLQKVEESQQKEQKRNWASQGLTELNQLLRSSDDLSDTYDQLISWIVRYMRVNQGSLYLYEEEGEEQFLELKACYAYNRKKYLNQRIGIGQGLIGQSYLEKDYIYLTEVPQDYVRITSGLGDANPDAILVIPLIVNDKVEGILELASFNEFEPHQIDFLQKAGEGIASTIARHRINRRTMLLLEESQEAAEQMRAQEEEMRQNMEELASTQEEMSRKEAYYQQEIEEYKQEIADLKKQLEMK